jgi:hypothetical protein
MTLNTATKITYLDNIPVMPEKKSIMSRLGHSARLTALSAKDQSFTDETISLGIALCRNQGATGRFAITTRTTGSVTLTDGDSLESRQLAKLLHESDEVLLMAGTVGSEITDRISREMEEGNAAKAVVLDAVASCSADIILDWLIEASNKMLQREAKRLTKHRYSPGFGDLPLSNQAVIFRLLGLERLQLRLTGSMMLVPEKSVLAIAGIERIKGN